MKISVKDRIKLHNKANVLGVGLSTKITKGLDTKERCAVVFVTEKLPPSKLSVEDLIPKTLGTFRKLKTDVVVCDTVHPMITNTHREKHRPIVGGISCAPNGTGLSGTIGLPIIYKDNIPVMLSNTHVIAPYWNNQWLQDTEIENFGIYEGTKIRQPSTQDKRATQDDFIGTLWEWATFTLGEEHTIDAAIAKIDVEAKPELLDLGPYTKIVVGKVGDKIKKSGRTSGITTGSINIEDFTVTVAYPHVGNINFIRQLGIRPAILSPGDSGSIIVNEKNEIIGLGFAGNDIFSVVTPIQEIFKHFNLTLKPIKKKETISGFYFWVWLIQTLLKGLRGRK